MPGSSGGSPSAGAAVKATKPPKPHSAPARQSTVRPRTTIPCADENEGVADADQCRSEETERVPAQGIVVLGGGLGGRMGGCRRRGGGRTLRRMLVGLGLEDEGNGAKLVRAPGENARERPGNERGSRDARDHGDVLALVAGKRESVPAVVGGVVNRIRLGEGHSEQQECSEGNGENGRKPG
jgi:hypothetical protein